MQMVEDTWQRRRRHHPLSPPTRCTGGEASWRLLSQQRSTANVGEGIASTRDDDSVRFGALLFRAGKGEGEREERRAGRERVIRLVEGWRGRGTNERGKPRAPSVSGNNLMFAPGSFARVSQSYAEDRRLATGIDINVSRIHRHKHTNRFV